MRTLILIDFSWLYNKYYYVTLANYSISSVKDKKSKEEALEKMLRQFLTLIESSYKGAKIMIALDSPVHTLNNYRIFKGYKQNRNKELKKEVYAFLNNILLKLVKNLNSKSFSFVKAMGYEADQILAYIVKKFYNQTKIIVFSGDKDLIQLTSYENVFISDKFEKGKFILKTDKELFQKFKNSKGEDFTRISKNKKDILKYRVLKGDTSDNLSPVFSRIKDKEIIDIIKNCWVGDGVLSENYIDSIIEEVKKGNEILAEKLEKSKDIWLRNYKIMDLLHVEGMKVKRLL